MILKCKHANVFVHFFNTVELTSIECRFNLYTEVDFEYQVDLTPFYSFVVDLVSAAQFCSCCYLSKC